MRSPFPFPTHRKVVMTGTCRPDPWSWLRSLAMALFAIALFFIVDGAMG